MILRYARTHGYAVATDTHLIIGNHYAVLGITLRPYPFPHEVTVIGDVDGLPRIRGMALFDLVDPRVPDGWVLNDLGRGFFRLEPYEFERDFWSRFHNRHPGALEIYAAVTGKIRDFHGVAHGAPLEGSPIHVDPRS
ncbi:MAG: hypothetical protein JWR21_1675 [Herminiimonas sp.]|nr:hypothetical protein [Herminiimonas sp.]MDB5853658.1 hypothetical protein [Herminiimonas sp.]